MTARSNLTPFRSADPKVARHLRAQVAVLRVQSAALERIAARRAELLALGEQVADELALRRLDELEAIARRPAPLALTIAPAGRGAAAAAGVESGEGGGAAPAPQAAPLPLSPFHPLSVPEL